jgi:hypothetical protein
LLHTCAASRKNGGDDVHPRAAAAQIKAVLVRSALLFGGMEPSRTFWIADSSVICSIPAGPGIQLHFIVSQHMDINILSSFLS